jgi:hypothetical protein
MPEFFITEPEIYEGTLSEALPQLASLWAFVCGTAFSIYLYCKIVNPTRVPYHLIADPPSQQAYRN